MPNSFAGAKAKRLTKSPRFNQPLSTRANICGKTTSKLLIPGSETEKGAIFAAASCGKWLLDTAEIVPSFKPCKSPRRSASLRKGGSK